MTKSPSPYADLLTRTLAGDAFAEKKLLERLAPTVREAVVCALFLADVRGQRGRRSPADVEDFMQETYVKLLDKKKAALRKFDPTRGSGNLEAYVCRIAKRVTIGKTRLLKSGRVETLTADDEMPDVPDDDGDPEVTLMNRELLELVLTELNLDEDEEELFYLHFVDGLPGPEICALLGHTMTSAALWKWTSRIREECRAIVEKLSRKGGAK